MINFLKLHRLGLGDDSRIAILPALKGEVLRANQINGHRASIDDASRYNSP
jgi:hypothetical protein